MEMIVRKVGALFYRDSPTRKERYRAYWISGVLRVSFSMRPLLGQRTRRRRFRARPLR